MIIIIDHGQGNIGSLSNTLNYLNLEHKICRSKDDASNLNIKGFILPGVGTFDAGVKEMKKRSLDKVVLDLASKDTKGIGICLGMQMLCQGSEEDNYVEEGLGIFKGYVKKLQTKDDIVPNIGWIETHETDHKKMAIDNICLKNAFYYIHSYAVNATNQEYVIAECEHGKRKITSAIYKDGILGVQFHPEKSQGAGLRLIQEYFKN